MKVLLDQGLPRGTARLLRERGLDAVHVGDIGLAEADDVTILERAVRDDRIVITLDSDFHALLALSSSAMPSVIRVREEGLDAEALETLLRVVLERFRGELERGAALSVRRESARLRRLPLRDRRR